jgi:hypothetical protein
MVKSTLVASLGAAVFTYALCILTALAVWAFGAHGDSRVDDALRAGSFAFLALHGSPFEIGEARFSLPLLGLTLLPILMLSRALGRAWRRQTIAGRVEMLTVGSLGVAPYLLFALGVSLFWSTSDAGVPLISSLLWVLLVACVSVAVAWWQVVRPSPLANVPAPQLALRTRRVLAGALIVLFTLFAFAFLLVLVSLLSNLTEMGAVITSLDSGVIGVLLLIALGLGWLPALTTWAVAYMLGPGFALGQETAITPLGVSYGELPSLPWFAALPTSAGGWHLLVLLVPVLAGLTLSAVLRGSLSRAGLNKWWRESLTAVLVAAIALWVIGWLTRGSLGQGRLSEFGAQPISLFLSCCLLVGVGASCLPLFELIKNRRVSRART